MRDAHVIETEETWEYMEGADRKFMPRIVAPSQESSPDEYWLVDERVHIRSVNVGRDTPPASRELRDVAVRLKHMDELGVDVQVLYPTIFLMPVTARAEVEVALCRGYNRWLAAVCKEAGGPAALDGRPAVVEHGGGPERSQVRQAERRLRHLHPRHGGGPAAHRSLFLPAV